MQVIPTILIAGWIAASASLAHAQTPPPSPAFNRIATFAAALNHDPLVLKDQKSVAEIVAASADGLLLAYTDSEQKGLGLVDIRNPAQPKAAGFVRFQGEPTSVVISGHYALVAVDMSAQFFQPEGELLTIDVRNRQIVQRCPLRGQPDALALDAKQQHVVVVLENQRDENFNRGALPQLPGGSLHVLPLRQGMPDCVRMHPVSLEGLADIAPTDPEPEFVKVNAQGLAVVSLQENNHIALVDVAQRRVVGHFSAGSVTVTGVDTQRDGIIRPVDSLRDTRREPDAVVWLDNERFMSANEGDYQGGTRGFSIFRKNGTVEFDSGNLLERLSIEMGHYPERRSHSKGNEPEGAEAAVFGADRLFFIASERASLIFVFRDMGAGQAPVFLQALPTGTSPEGLVAIPQRNVLVAASEADGPARAGLTIYLRGNDAPQYPTLVSASTNQGQTIAWGAISGTVADQREAGILWAVTDSAYRTARILRIDARSHPAVIRDEITLTQDGRPLDLLDAEGIAQREDGGFWIASEGNPERREGAIDDLLLRTNAQGVVQETIRLPEAIRRHAVRFGLEGVTRTGSGAQERVWLAVQREWKDDPAGRAKIISYHPATQQWGVYHYPLNPTTTPGAWVGISEIMAVSDDTFWVIERDNQFGSASFKAIQSFTVANVRAASPGDAQIPVLNKQLVRNLVPDLQAPRGIVLDKVESLARDVNRQIFIITDNDGVDGSNGETQLLRINLNARRVCC